MAKLYSRFHKNKTLSAGAANLAFNKEGVAEFNELHLADVKQLCRAKPGFSLEPFDKAKPKKEAPKPAPKPEPKKEEPKATHKEEPKAEAKEEKPKKKEGFSLFAKDAPPVQEEKPKNDKKKSKDKGE